MSDTTIYMYGYAHELLDNPGDELPAPEPIGYFATEDKALLLALQAFSITGNSEYVKPLCDGKCNVYKTTSRLNCPIYIYIWNIESRYS